MLLIKDIRDNLVATAEQETGEVDARHGDRGVKFTLAEGQKATLTRKGTTTEVIRSHGNFIINRL